MITSPNDIPDCLLWLDALDTSTMFQDISVVSSQRRNLFPMSNTLFSRTRVAVSEEQYLQLSGGGPRTPDGTQIANSFYDTTFDNRARYLRVLHYVPKTSTYTLSFYAKPEGFNFIYITFDGVAGYVNLLTGATSGVTGGTISTTLASHSSEFPGIPGSSSWYRIHITKTLTGSTTSKYLDIYARPTATGTTTSRVGDTLKGVAIWGMMLEEASAKLSYIPTPTLQASFLDGSFTTKNIIPITPVTSLNQSIGYWRNKSLSATVIKLSGVHVYEENSSYRPTLNAVSSLTGVFFDADYLSTPVLPTPLSATAQTVFIVARSDNSSELIQSQSYALFGQALSGSIGHGDQTCYNPVLRPHSTSTCINIGVTGINFIPLAHNWLTRTPTPLTEYNRASFYHEESNDQFNIYTSVKTPSNTYALYYNRVGNEYSRGSYDIFSSTRPSFTAPAVIPSMSAVDIIRLGTTIDKNTLELTTSFGWNTSNSFRNNGSGNFVSGKGQNLRYGEVIMYNRALTKDEIDDVEEYLRAKWRKLAPREVWALSNGLLSSSNIFSISSEPTPFNVLLSSDIVYTNGYSLTAASNQILRTITNTRVPVTGRVGGEVVMTENVSLTSDIVGGVGPYTVLVPSGTSCNITGNIFGGGTFNDTVVVLPVSSFTNPGVQINSNGTLYLSGSIYGGFNTNSCGIVTDGGMFYYSNRLQGGGTFGYNQDYTPVGGVNSFGVSAINTTLTLRSNNIQHGLCSAGLYTRDCVLILDACDIQARHSFTSNSIIPNGPSGITTGNVCIACDNTTLSAFNTRFLGTTATNIATGSYYVRSNPDPRHSGTALWARNSSKIYLENCYVEGGRRSANTNGWDTEAPILGLNQAVRLTSGTSLTGVNCIVNGARNGGITSENSNGKVGLYIESGTTATFLNTKINTEANAIFNRGIYNSGTLTLSGTVKGGYRAVSTSYPGIYNRGNLTVSGIITPNYSGSAAIDNESNGTARIYGKILPGGPLSNTVTSRGMLSAWYSEPLISSTRGFVPIAALQCVFISLCSNSLYTQFSVDGVQQTTRFLDNDYNLNQPLSSDVLKNYVYGPIGFELTGTSIIPEVSATIVGVPVRSVYGSRKPLTVDAFWNQPITSVTTLSTAVYEKIINPITSVSLSAITLSLTDLPPPGV